MYKKVINPLVFYGAVTQPVGNVLERIFDTDDPRLIGHVIPEGVKDTKLYLETYSKFLDRLEEVENGEINLHEETVQTGIMKAESVPVKSDTVIEDIANFTVRPTLRKIYLNRDGAEIYDKESFDCEVIFKSGRVNTFEIQTKDLSNLVKRIRKRFSEAIVSCEQMAMAEKVIESEFRVQTEYAPVQIYLTEAGWQSVDGNMRYIHDGILFRGGCSVETGLDLPGVGIDGIKCGKIYLSSLHLYSDMPVMHVLSLFSLLGILYRCFRIAGYPPHFLLFMNGRTGSLKTTIAKILYTQLSKEDFRDTPRRLDTDTTTSFERGIVMSGYDTILLFDDYAPAKTPQKKREMKNKLETIIRMVGDGSTTSRSNSNLEDIRGTGVQGMVVVTGEIRGKGASSNLRCLYAEMKRGCAKLDTISWFQANPTAYSAMLNGFADYVGTKWKEIVDYIKKTFPIERVELSKSLVEQRVIDTAATLRIASDILLDFLVEYCGLLREHLTNLCSEMRQSVVTVAQLSQAVSQEEAYSVTFIKALHELMQTGKIRLHDSKPESSDKLDTFDGFFDNSAYYFYLPSLYGRFLTYFQGTNRYFPLDPDEMATELYQDGVSSPSANGTDSRGKERWSKYWRVQVKNSKVKVNFVKIRRSIFEEVLNGKDIEELQKRINED